jgi:XTP/dITP diphosphohydrolase
MDIILATFNPGKIREYRSLFKAIPQVELYSLRDFPDYDEPEETGETFEANAVLKAERAAKMLGKWAMADDSGLVVPSLEGQPGVHSRYYAGQHATDAENRKKLLKALEGKNDWERSAYFECVITIATPEGQVKSFTGRCEGYLTDKERGGNGFGYDPLFIKHDYDKTFAELDESVKNLVSHRRKAFEKLIVFLESKKGF